jgi:hypothetical protein
MIVTKRLIAPLCGITFWGKIFWDKRVLSLTLV